MGCETPFLYYLFALAALPFVVQAKIAPFFDQSFFFDWNPPGQPLPIPVTAQCETINITWGRAAATGPNPVAPYYLQVYSSAYTVPIIIPAGNGLTFSWAVPFPPNTRYQICMFDKNGNTGGCQDIYTVIPPVNNTTCPNVTLPSTTLDVDGVVINGPMSRYGWINQCTDLSLTPKNGTPPYILTIAPSLHPPANITTNTKDAINWTVSLSWASPFFVSLVDSKGNTWANGPLHSGEGNPSCLSLSSTPMVPQSRAVGAGVGGTVAGAFFAVLAALLYDRFRTRRKISKYDEATDAGYHDLPSRDAPRDQQSGSQTSDLPVDPSRIPLVPNRLFGSSGRNPEHRIEPFPLTNSCPDSSASELQQMPSSNTPVPSSSTVQQPSHVYVVHHDAGRAPVTVYTAQGTEVVELPPQYMDNSSSSDISRNTSATQVETGTSKNHNV